MSPFLRLPAIRRGDRYAGLSVLLILLGLYTATFNGLPDNPDAEVEFQTTSSLAREGSLALGGTPEADAILAVDRGTAQGFNVHEGGPGREGRFYSWFGVGQAIAALPLYYAGAALAVTFPQYEERHAETTHYGVPRSEYFQHLLVGWRNPLLGACTGYLLVLVARRLGASRRSAWLAGLAYGTTTFAWPQARSTLSDVQATFFLFLAFHQLLCIRERVARLEQPARLALISFGAALGAAVLTRVAVVLGAGALAGMALPVLLRARRRMRAAHAIGAGEAGRPRRGAGELSLRRSIAWIAAGALPCAALFLYANHVRFGSPFLTGYESDVGAGFFGYSPLLSLAGLTLSPGKGLLWLAPGVLLLPWGIVRARRGGEWLWPWTTLVVALGILALVLPTLTWDGASTYGPRYVLPMLPFLWLGVAFGLDWIESKPKLAIAFGCVFVLGFLTNVPGVLVDHTTHEELAIAAGRIAYPAEPTPAEPDAVAPSQRDRDAVFFHTHMNWDWRFAAPWAHWRILRHRVATGREDFPLARIYGVETEAAVRPTWERDQGFRHVAWVDFHERLGGSLLPAVVLCSVLLLAGLGFGIACLQRANPE